MLQWHIANGRNNGVYNNNKNIITLIIAIQIVYSQKKNGEKSARQKTSEKINGPTKVNTKLYGESVAGKASSNKMQWGNNKTRQGKFAPTHTHKHTYTRIKNYTDCQNHKKMPLPATLTLWHFNTVAAGSIAFGEPRCHLALATTANSLATTRSWVGCRWFETYARCFGKLSRRTHQFDGNSSRKSPNANNNVIANNFFYFIALRG